MLIAAATISTIAFFRESATSGSATKHVWTCKTTKPSFGTNASYWSLNLGIHRIGLGVPPLARMGLGLGVRRATPLLLARSTELFLRIGDASRTEPFAPAGLAAIRGGCGAVRPRIFEACSSFDIQVLGLRSMAMAPCGLTFITVAGNHSLCDEERYSTRSPTW